MTKKSKITAPERDKIAVLFSSGSSLRSIARQLGRSVSSISVEVRRNSVEGEYRSIAAQEISHHRNVSSRRLNPLKSSRIFAYVCDKLRCGWSPEQIAGRLRRDCGGKSVICHETIYRYIYSQEGKKKGLTDYLVRHHHRRYKWHGRSQYHRGIFDRTSIRLRSKTVDTRKTFGHWEADVVEGKGHDGGIQTLLERKTRFYQAKLLPEIDSEYGVRAQNSLLLCWPKRARKTITFDNGKENYNHFKLKKWLGLQTYFCDPYCSWQKGSNENHNGILRRYIPKGADLTGLSQEDLDAILEEINDRPRKCLGYETSSEAFLKELKFLQKPKCSDST